jgi:ferredoxin
MLRKIRIGVSILLGALITIYFLDFAELLPHELRVLEEIQLLPALLALNVGVLVALTLLTLLFGRVYCSSVCPLGVYQDVVSRLRKWTSSRKTKKRYKYLPPLNWLRYGFLGLTLVAFVAGLHVLVGLLDPYSAFGRMTVHLLKPVYQAGNNLLFSIFSSFDNHTFYKIAIYLLSVSSLVVALVTLVVVSVMAWRNGRIYCNTVCPVGTTLGLVSRFSLFQIRFDSSACTLCGSCARTCKSSCIDFKQMKVDSSRCINCFDCIDVCKESGLHYRLPRKGERVIQKLAAVPASTSKKRESSVDEALKMSLDGGSMDGGSMENGSRRLFLSAVGITGLAATRLVADSSRRKIEKMTAGAESTSGKRYVPELGIELGPKRDVARTKPILPPGATRFDHFTEKCTSCHLCVAKCPAQVIKPAFLDYGLGGMLQPMMNFDHHFCNYDCTICSDVCPTDALLPLTKDDKHHNQMGVVQLYLENCIVYTDETSCGACSEHCPTQAVHMVPYKDSLTIPKIEQAICVGCGGCEYVCPAKPWKAIFVEGKAVHERIELEFEAVEETTVDGFGF